MIILPKIVTANVIDDPMNKFYYQQLNKLNKLWARKMRKFGKT